jgi:hypothetical protein
MKNLHKRILIATMFLGFSSFASAVQAQQGIRCELWTGSQAGTVTNPQQLADSPLSLGTPNSTFTNTSFLEAPLNTSGNFVRRCIAKFNPPSSGTYFFYCSGNQQMKAWLSIDGPNFGGTPPLCQSTIQPPPPSRNYTARTEQKSGVKSLIASRTYYIMFIQIEADGNNINHASVGWQLPNGYFRSPCTASPCYERPMSQGLTSTSYPLQISLNASPSTINCGQTFILTWNVFFGGSCAASSIPLNSLWSGSKPNSGTLALNQCGSSVYRLTCAPTAGGSNQTQELTISSSGSIGLSLTWDPNPITGDPEVDAIGYYVNYGNSTGTYTNVIFVGTQTQYTITNFPSSGGYFFAITARDAQNQVSPYSNEVSSFISIP